MWIIIFKLYQTILIVIFILRSKAPLWIFAASLIRAVRRPTPQRQRRARIRERSHRDSRIYIYIYIYIYIFIRIPVATLPDSSLPLTLRGGSAYGPYEWCCCSSHKKNKQIGPIRFNISNLVQLILKVLIIKFYDPGSFTLAVIVKTTIGTYSGVSNQNLVWSTQNFIIYLFL